MPSIALSRVAFSYSGAAPLLDELDFQLVSGWTGLVGANGCGKTTFLNLILGTLEPDAGEIRRSPGHLNARLCSQRVEVCEPAIRTFAVVEDGTAQRLRGELELQPDDLQRWPSLSPGERKRWQIGAALADEPDVLMLDEPTNHLDAVARRLLLHALRGFGGIGLLVSHDRGFLDALTDRTLRCHAGSVRLYRGSYEQARAVWEQEEHERAVEREKLKHEDKKLRARLRDKTEKRTKAQSQRRKVKRPSGRRGVKGSKLRSSGEHAASSTFKSHRRRSSAISLARDMRVIGGAMERVESKLSQTQVDKELGRSLFVDYDAAPVPWLASLQRKELCVPGRVLLRNVDLQLGREQRIHLAGPNGAGKTTLLEALVAQFRIPVERLLYLPQELERDAERELLDQVRGLTPEARGRVLTVLAALGVDPDRLLASRSLSPGEARKLMLAFALARRVWALVLDEPTNHMDLPAIERLESALAAYPGALLLVTHDDVFAQRCTDTQWRLDGAGGFVVRDVST